MLLYNVRYHVSLLDELINSYFNNLNSKYIDFPLLRKTKHSLFSMNLSK